MFYPRDRAVSKSTQGYEVPLALLNTTISRTLHSSALIRDDRPVDRFQQWITEPIDAVQNHDTIIHQTTRRTSSKTTGKPKTKKTKKTKKRTQKSPRQCPPGFSVRRHRIKRSWQALRCCRELLLRAPFLDTRPSNGR